MIKELEKLFEAHYKITLKDFPKIGLTFWIFSQSEHGRSAESHFEQYFLKFVKEKYIILLNGIDELSKNILIRQFIRQLYPKMTSFVYGTFADEDFKSGVNSAL